MHNYGEHSFQTKESLLGPMFEIKAAPLSCTRAVGSFQENQSVGEVQRWTLHEHAAHF